MISPTRHLPNARKDQWSFDVQRELARGTALDFQYVGSHTQHLDRSFFNNTPQPGQGAMDPRRPTQTFKSRRMIQNDFIADYDAVQSALSQAHGHGLQVNVALHLVEDHATWPRTRTAAARR